MILCTSCEFALKADKCEEEASGIDQILLHRPLATRPHSLTAINAQAARWRHPELMASDDIHTEAATAYILPYRDSSELIGKRLITTCRPREGIRKRI